MRREGVGNRPGKRMRRAFLAWGLEPFPGYRLRRFLGSGGFGQVWEASAPDGRLVALKFLPADETPRAAQETRTLQQVAGLRHDNLIGIERIWCFGGYLVVSMELADGSLRDLYHAYQACFGTPIVAEHLWLLLGQAAAALDFLNRRQHRVRGQRVAVQHCDVKPGNLLLRGHRLKVSDFSVATLTTARIQPHRRAGTLAYTAPEVFQGRLSDRTDQYALAVTYCEMRGGRTPFEKEPTRFDKRYVRPAPLLDMLAEEERPIIARALSPVPTERWNTCTEMVEELQNAVLEKTSLSAPPTPGAARVRRSRPTRVPKPAKDDRRNTVRHRCNLSTTWRLMGEQGHRCWQAGVLDISARGIAILCAEPVPRGTLLVVSLEDCRQVFSRSLFARVARCVKQPDGEWLIGCTFSRPLNPDELEALLHARAVAVK